MTSQHTPTDLAVTNKINQIKQIKDAIRTVFKDSDRSITLQSICDNAILDIKNLESQRGINKKILTFIGHKNAGKSTLCKLLVVDEFAKKRIKSGTGHKNATTKITWIGDQKPTNINQEQEEIINVPEESLIDLNTPYILTDVPGYDDLNKTARLAAKKILGMTHIVIATTSWDRIGDESYLRQLKHSNGARILPIIKDANLHKRSKEHAEKNIKSFIQSIKRFCPDSEILTPIIVPQINNSPELENETQSILTKALKELLKKPDVNNVPILQQKYDQLIQTLAIELDPFLSKISAPYAKLCQQEKTAAITITKEIIGDERQLRAYLRIRLLSETVEKCPQVFFPFRAFASIWALTMGAWDRLILALFGSIPSLFSVMIQSGKNIKQTFNDNHIVKKALNKRCSNIAKSLLAEPEKIFYRSIRENLKQDYYITTEPADSTAELRGLDELESATAKILIEGVNASPPKEKTMKSLGFLATALVAIMSIGPFVALYSAFFKAWIDAIFSGQSGLSKTWSNFPTPDFGMVSTSIFLIVFPAILLSFIAVVSAVSQKRQKHSIQTVHTKMNQLIETLNKNNTLHLHRDDNTQNAVKLLLTYCYQTNDPPETNKHD